ncbi:hypothetical protein TrCOL_g10331 [Triparma columacea]|uniref:Uncharacterized protein n=1 Tax=Triparma columacea TaxID=722753 RepID=A0A9W7G6L4_9STRA|nr:hypothetical protein TrCOL_g10331 [Triparma columacea]
MQIQAFQTQKEAFTPRVKKPLVIRDKSGKEVPRVVRDKSGKELEGGIETLSQDAAKGAVNDVVPQVPHIAQIPTADVEQSIELLTPNMVQAQAPAKKGGGGGRVRKQQSKAELLQERKAEREKKLRKALAFELAEYVFSGDAKEGSVLGNSGNKHIHERLEKAYKKKRPLNQIQKEFPEIIGIRDREGIPLFYSLYGYHSCDPPVSDDNFAWSAFQDSPNACDLPLPSFSVP